MRRREEVGNKGKREECRRWFREVRRMRDGQEGGREGEQRWDCVYSRYIRA